MAPSINILRALLADPELQDSGSIPAKAWLENRGDNVATGIVPFMGNLSIIACAQLANWFETHVAVDKKLRHYWLGHLPIAHACTLYLVALLQKNPNALNVKKFNVNDDNDCEWHGIFRRRMYLNGFGLILMLTRNVWNAWKKKCSSVRYLRELRGISNGDLMQGIIKIVGTHMQARRLCGTRGPREQ